MGLTVFEENIQKYSLIPIGRENIKEYSFKYCQSHRTMLWI